MDDDRLHFSVDLDDLARFHDDAPERVVPVLVDLVDKGLGGPIWFGNDIHHIEVNKLNNSPENLRVLPTDEHRRFHFRMRRKRY